MSATSKGSARRCETPQIPAVIYAAKSSPQDQDESTGAQIERCRERIGREPDRVLCGDPFSEENVSAYHGNRGPELEAAIKAAVQAADRHGQAELWVWKSNRLARGSGRRSEARSLLELFTDLRRQGVTLRSVTDDEYLREEFIGMASRMAHKFAEDLGSDVQRGRRRAFEAGEHGGGPCWDGYRDTPQLDADGQPIITARGKVKMRREIDPERQPTISRLWELLLAGIADPSVARTLNREGHRTKDGKAWSRRRVQDTRMNPAYAGAVVWHRGKPDQEINWNGLHDGRYVTPEQWEQIQAMCAGRDRAASGRPRGGRPTRRYALSKLAVCDRCGEPMYASTSPYKRKRDGGKARTYLCKNVHGGTGLCDAPRIDAEAVDSAVVSHLDSLFIDFDAWMAELDKSTEQQRTAVQAALDAELAKLGQLEQRAQRIENDYLRQVDEGNDRAADFVARMLDRTANERRTVEQAISAYQATLTQLDEPATDAMLDVYSRLRDCVRGAATDDPDSLGTLNERLRAVFAQFRLDKVADDVVGILPILRSDVVERYGSDKTMLLADDEAVPFDQPTSPAAPVALFASGAEPIVPPAKALKAPLTKTGNHSHEPWHFGYTRNAGTRSVGFGGRIGDGRSAVPSFVPREYADEIARAAQRWNVGAALLSAQIYAESNFNPFARSSAGAQGIAQFMPATARSMGLANPFDPAASIDAQAHLMRDLLRRFGSVPLALAAYNAGPAPVAACGCVPPYRETQDYVAKILGLLSGAGDATTDTLEVRLVE